MGFMTRTGELMVGMTARVMARMMELRTRVMQLLMKKSSCQSFHSEPAKEETGSEGTPAGTPTAGNGRNPEVLHGASGALALKGAGGWTGHDSFPADGWLTNPNQVRFPGEPRPRVPPPAPPLPRSHLTASYPTQPPTQAFSSRCWWPGALPWPLSRWPPGSGAAAAAGSRRQGTVQVAAAPAWRMRELQPFGKD